MLTKMKNVIMVLISGMFDAYRSGKTNMEYNAYGEMADKTLSAEQGIYHILMTVAVYASGIAVLVVGAMLVVNGRNKNKRAEEKGHLVKVFIIVVLIFAATGVVNLIQDVAA